MFSPHRRILGKRAGMRLEILSLMCIAGLLAISGSPTWLQPARYALAQDETATPTDVPPNPTASLGAPPLTLQSSASVASAVASQQFSFTTSIAANSVEPRAIELRASIDSQLELLSASGGSCSAGNGLVCKLNVQAGQPVTIVATVRVRPSAAAGSQLVYQALAQDDLSNTAASDQVVVTIAPPPTPTSPPEPAPSSAPPPSAPANGAHTSAPPTARPTSRPARPAPTAIPTIAAKPVAQSTAVPVAPALPTVPAAIMHSSAGAATAATPADSAAAASWLELAPEAPAQPQALEPSAPAPMVPQPDVQAPAAAPSVPMLQQRQIVQLPNTAAFPPIAGLVALLMGLALTLHGFRRVRHAARQLEHQSAALGRLATLADAAARRRARVEDQR